MLEAPIVRSSKSLLQSVLGSGSFTPDDTVVPMSAGARALVMAERSEVRHFTYTLMYDPLTFWWSCRFFSKMLSEETN